MHWINQLHAFDEETMIRLMGRDLSLYLKFLKYQAVQFFIIFLFSFATIIPLYWTGSDATVYFETISQNSTAVSTNETVNATIVASKSANTYGLTERDTGYNLLMITMLNIQTDELKLLGSYSFIYLTTVVVYIQIFRFWR